MSLHALTWAFEQNLPCAHKFVLVAIADQASPTGECYPSQRTLAERCGLSRTRVNQIVGELEESGFLHIASRTRKNGADSSNLYILACPEEVLPSRDERPADVPGVLYVLSDGHLCKIGISRDLERRVRALTTATGRTLEVVGVINCPMSVARKLEREAHRHFDSCRQQGEWFAIQGLEAYSWIKSTAADVVLNHLTPPVKTNDTRAVKHGNTPALTSLTPVSTEPSVSNPPLTEAREAEWKSVWEAFKTWPGLSVRASERKARLAWDRLEAVLPLDLAGRILAFGRQLAAENDRRGSAGQALVVHPHNWLERDEGWKTVAAGPAGPSQAEIDAAADFADRYFKRGKYREAA